MPLDSLVIGKPFDWVFEAERWRWVRVEKLVVQHSAVQTTNVFSVNPA